MSRPENILHAANVVVSTIGAVTAESALPGANAAVGGNLSVASLLRSFRPPTSDLDTRVAAQLEDALKNNHLTGKARKLIPQMIAVGALTPGEIMLARRDPALICDAMLKKLDDPAHKPDGLHRDFRSVLEPIFAELLTDTDIADRLRPEFENAVAASLAHIQDIAEKLLSRFEQTARQANINEGMLIGLARNYAAGEISDFESAYSGVEQALKLAAEDQQKGALPSNMQEAVEQVIARVDALNRKGKFEEAEEELEEALRASEERMDEEHATRHRIFDKGMKQAVYSNKPEAASTWIIRRLESDHPNEHDFWSNFEETYKTWHKNGKHKGFNFTGRVAVHLARYAVRKFEGGANQGPWLVRLGNSYHNMGRWTADLGYPQRSIDAFEDALELFSQGNALIDHFEVLHNLGGTLQIAGSRETGSASLARSVAILEKGLSIWTSDKDPIKWAKLTATLANTQRTIGEKEKETQSLRKAVKIFEDFFEKTSRETLPEIWAQAKSNMGSALYRIATLETETDTLYRAINTLSDALKIRTRDAYPQDWAETKNNLGITFTLLGNREHGLNHLEAAKRCFEECILEWTKAESATGWAIVNGNLCELEIAFFDRTGKSRHLDLAQSYLDEARSIFEKGKNTRYLQLVDEFQSDIDRRKNLRSGG